MYPVKTLIKNLERRTFGGQIFMLHVDRKALRDSVEMDKFHQMSDLLMPFVGLPVGRRMIL